MNFSEPACYDKKHKQDSRLPASRSIGVLFGHVPNRQLLCLLMNGRIAYLQRDTEVSSSTTICPFLTSLRVGQLWLFQPYTSDRRATKLQTFQFANLCIRDLHHLLFCHYVFFTMQIFAQYYATYLRILIFFQKKLKTDWLTIKRRPYHQHPSMLYMGPSRLSRDGVLFPNSCRPSGDQSL